MSDTPHWTLHGLYRCPILGGERAMSYQSDDEPPPFFRTWGQLYAAVLVVLLIVIILLYWLTERFVEVHR